jgi:hypothetical protein
MPYLFRSTFLAHSLIAELLKDAISTADIIQRWTKCENYNSELTSVAKTRSWENSKKRQDDASKYTKSCSAFLYKNEQKVHKMMHQKPMASHSVFMYQVLVVADRTTKRQ